jgi:hypothetical protein
LFKLLERLEPAVCLETTHPLGVHLCLCQALLLGHLAIGPLGVSLKLIVPYQFDASRPRLPCRFGSLLPLAGDFTAKLRPTLDLGEHLRENCLFALRFDLADSEHAL